jgi:hypothetical protein
LSVPARWRPPRKWAACFPSLSADDAQAAARMVVRWYPAAALDDGAAGRSRG